MGNCLGSSSKQKAPPKQPVVTTPQATYPPPMQQQLQPYNAPPIHQPHAPMQQSHSSYNAPPIHQPYAPIQQSRIPMQQPYPPIQQSHIPPPPPIQRSHTPMQQMYTPPVQRPYSQVQQSSLTYKALPPINAQFNDQSPAINHLQSPQTPNPDYGLNPTVPSANVEVVSDSKVLAQYITKTNQNFEDYGIDDPIERNLQPPPKDAFCLNCQDGKVDTDPDGFPGEYCSNECRKDAISGGFGNSPCVQCKEFPQVTNSQFCGWKNCRNLPLCINCKAKEAYPCSLWCSKTCRDQTPNWQRLVNERSNEMCLYCKRENALAGYDFCSDDCEASIKKKTPCLLRLPSGGQKYKDITNQFNAAWKHPHKVVPEITSIWKIYCSDHLNKRYNIYRDEVENHHKLAGNPFPKGDGKRKMSAGNEQRRFHGTKTSCYLGLTNDANICGDPACSVCCIIKEGYKLRFVGTGTISAAFQRFGRGIYFSGTSSKSDDYNEGSLKYFQGSNYKVMIMNKVVVGQGYPLTKDNMKLTEPPPGFNSILGEPSKTGNLNYDEVVVYREEASIPQYLIVYKVK